jgi:hypothetical protein
VVSAISAPENFTANGPYEVLEIGDHFALEAMDTFRGIEPRA